MVRVAEAIVRQEHRMRSFSWFLRVYCNIKCFREDTICCRDDQCERMFVSVYDFLTNLRRHLGEQLTIENVSRRLNKLTAKILVMEQGDFRFPRC